MVDKVDILRGRDVRSYHPQKADFVWASPPCTEYSYFNRKFSTWESKYDADFSLILEVFRILREAKPRLWILENVKGLQQVLGNAPYNFGAFFLWGRFPFELLPTIPWTTSLKGTHADRSQITASGNVKQTDDGKSAAEKAMIPPKLAKEVFEICDRFFSQEWDPLKMLEGYQVLEDFA